MSHRRGPLGLSPSRRVFIYVSLFIATALVIFPAVWMFLMSVRPDVEIFIVPPEIWPKHFTWIAYSKVLTNPVDLRFFLNSYLVASVVTIGSIFFAILAGYGFSRFNFKGKRGLTIFVISTQSIPPITLLIPYFSMVVALKIYDTYFGLFFTYAALTLPYAVLMMTSYFDTISTELDEAVLVDGGSRMQALWRIIVPISLPGMVATAVYAFLLAWNEYLFALTLTKSMSMRTIPVGISLLMGQHDYQWNVMLSISVLGSLPVLLLYFIGQRYFLAGMTAGSVKS